MANLQTDSNVKFYWYAGVQGAKQSINEFKNGVQTAATDKSAIYFVPETKEILVNDTWFGVNDQAFTDLQNLVGNIGDGSEPGTQGTLIGSVEVLKEKVGFNEQINQSIIKVLGDVASHLDGRNIGGTQGPQALTTKINNGNGTDTSNISNVTQAINALNAAIGTLVTRTTWTAVSKDTNDAKFATSVTQGVDGKIAVEYGNIRKLPLDDSVTTGQYVTAVSQGIDGQITVTRGGVDASNVTFNTSGTGLTKTNVQEAIAEGYQSAMALKGVQATDAYTAETIAGAKNYTDYKIQELAGTDWTEAAHTVSEIIKELDNSDVAGNWATMVDKLEGMQVSEKGTSGQTGYRPANANPSVVEYVTAAIQDVNAANAEGIADLDAIVTGLSDGTSDATANADSTYTKATTQLVAVKVTEVDGKITAVNVKTNDVAKASDLTTLSNTVVKSVNGIQATNNAVTLTGSDVHVNGTDDTSVATALSNLDTNKANKSAINPGKVNNWTASYAAEQLTWTSVETDVYVPSSSGSL